MPPKEGGVARPLATGPEGTLETAGASLDALFAPDWASADSAAPRPIVS